MSGSRSVAQNAAATTEREPRGGQKPRARGLARKARAQKPVAAARPTALVSSLAFETLQILLDTGQVGTFDLPHALRVNSRRIAVDRIGDSVYRLIKVIRKASAQD